MRAQRGGQHVKALLQLGGAAALRLVGLAQRAVVRRRATQLALQPRALDELIPDWRDDPDAPLRTPVTGDQFKFLTSETRSVPLPCPPSLHNDGNYITSLSQVARWLGERAEEAGVEIYPGFSAAEVLFDDSGAEKPG